MSIPPVSPLMVYMKSNCFGPEIPRVASDSYAESWLLLRLYLRRLPGALPSVSWRIHWRTDALPTRSKKAPWAFLNRSCQRGTRPMIRAVMMMQETEDATASPTQGMLLIAWCSCIGLRTQCWTDCSANWNLPWTWCHSAQGWCLSLSRQILLDYNIYSYQHLGAFKGPTPSKNKNKNSQMRTMTIKPSSWGSNSGLLTCLCPIASAAQFQEGGMKETFMRQSLGCRVRTADTLVGWGVLTS